MKSNPEQKKTREMTRKPAAQTVRAEKAKKNEGQERVSLNHARAGGTHLIPKYKEFYDAEVEKLRERFLYILESIAADKYRYEWLENRSGISAARWQHVFLEKQLPTVDMLIFALQAWPNYTYWLMHGVPQPPELRDRPDPNIERVLLGPTAPSEASFNTFRDHREWIKQQRISKAAAKTEKKSSSSQES